MDTPADRRYTNEHEWAREEGNVVRIGITDYAQQELGDIVFVELPEPGTEVKAGDSFATLESVKAASDLYAPIDGKVTAANPKLEEKPELVNELPYGEGWFVELEPTDKSQLESLMDATAYDALVADAS